MPSLKVTRSEIATLAGIDAVVTDMRAYAGLLPVNPTDTSPDGTTPNFANPTFGLYCSPNQYWPAANVDAADVAIDTHVIVDAGGVAFVELVKAPDAKFNKVSVDPVSE